MTSSHRTAGRCVTLGQAATHLSPRYGRASKRFTGRAMNIHGTDDVGDGIGCTHIGPRAGTLWLATLTSSVS